MIDGRSGFEGANGLCVVVYHWPRYGLICVLPLLLSGYVELPLLAIVALPSLPHPTLLFAHSGRQDQANQACVERRRLAVQLQSQLQAHSPVLQRTLL